MIKGNISVWRGQALSMAMGTLANGLSGESQRTFPRANIVTCLLCKLLSILL